MAYIYLMEITRDTVNQWLENEHRSQSWLAEKCGVSVQAVSNWLRGNKYRPISAGAQITIRALMDEDAAKAKARPLQNLVLEFSDNEYKAIGKAALAAGELVPSWAKHILNAAADEEDAEDIVRRFQKPHLLAAAGSPISAEVTDWDAGGDTVMVRICGLSMVPLLNDGDVVAMKHKKASRNSFMKKGVIYLVEYDGGYTVKRYNTRPPKPEEKGEEWVERGKVKVLESINPDFPEIIIKQPLEWIAWLDKV